MSLAEKVDGLRAVLLRHVHADGQTRTEIPSLSIVRRTVPSRPVDGVYPPLICFVVGGAKRIEAGRETVDVRKGEMVVTSVELPVAGRAAAATADEPFVAFSLELDLDVVADLALGMGVDARSCGVAPPMVRFRPPSELVDAAFRLSALLDGPADIPFLAPLAKREIIYHLLRQPEAAALHRLTADGRQMAAVRRVAAWMKQHPTAGVAVADLADMAAMSPSAFHRHFRSATSLSPAEFHKRMRLHEARRLMAIRCGTTSSVALQVGYESASHFARDYRRIYGASPASDIAAMRSHDPMGA